MNALYALKQLMFSAAQPCRRRDAVETKRYTRETIQPPFVLLTFLLRKGVPVPAWTMSKLNVNPWVTLVKRHLSKRERDPRNVLPWEHVLVCQLCKTA